MRDKKRVLILCTGNSARSQMAEGLLRFMAGDRFDVFSAGTQPREVHPKAIEAMKEVGIDITGQRSKDVAEFAGQHFDDVITVCDRSKQACPIFPGSEPIHWGFDDPVEVEPARQDSAFRQVREELSGRFRLFIAANKV